MNTTHDIFQGDHSPVYRCRPTALPDGQPINGSWKCHIGVTDENDRVVMAKREVTAKTSDGLRWLAALTPAETGALAPGAYYNMVIEVSNTTTTPPFNKEKRVQFKLLHQGIHA